MSATPLRTDSAPTHRRAILTAVGIAASLAIAVIAAEAIRPRERIASLQSVRKLADIVPETFGDWRLDRSSSGLIVNPEVQANLDTIYSDVLARTYVDSAGRRIMLSIAYGADQTDSAQIHRPEVCYPAQGFVLLSRTTGTLPVSGGRVLPVVMLETRLGLRHEPVTYWIRVGDRIANDNLDKKLTELSYGLRGQIPDGLLFRVSSIDRDSEQAFRLHRQFIETLLGAVPDETRLRMTGRSTPPRRTDG
jgi:EpsI family protein